MAEFNPFDNSTWKEPSLFENPETREHLIGLIEAFISKNEQWSFMLELAHRLEGTKSSLNFYRTLHRKPDLKKLVDWLLSSEPRQERASIAIRKWLRLKRCPGCGSLIDETELIDPPEFSWEEFANQEE